MQTSNREQARKLVEALLERYEDAAVAAHAPSIINALTGLGLQRSLATRVFGRVVDAERYERY